MSLEVEKYSLFKVIFKKHDAGQDSMNDSDVLSQAVVVCNESNYQSETSLSFKHVIGLALIFTNPPLPAFILQSIILFSAPILVMCFIDTY
jgi:hypothetical protein